MSNDLLAVCLALSSAITLAAANLSVKMGSDILAARAILSASAACVLLPLAFFVEVPDAATWTALAKAVPAHFAYQLCLIATLKRGELSLVFPVMRGTAPLLTAAAAFLLLGERLPLLALLGLIVAVAAVLLFAVPPQGVSLGRHPDRGALGWALATSVGIALYSVADAHGVRTAPSAFTYIVWIFLLDAVGVCGLALFRRRAVLLETITRRWRYGVSAGMLSVISYGAAVYAFSLVETARVSALRETSVIFAAAMGAIFLREGFGRRRILAALALATGLLAMQLAR